MTDAVKFKDFSKKRPPVSFGIDGEEFPCYPALAVEDLQDLALSMQGAADEDGNVKIGEMLDRVKAAFKIVLPEESYQRLIVKMRDRNNPVDVDQLQQIISWLVEQYVDRPTPPSSDSSTGSPSGGFGIPSTDGVSAEE